MSVNKHYWRTRERNTQIFERMQPQYFLNSQGVLEESPIMVDTQEKINSVEYTKLHEIYDKFIIMDRAMHTVHDGGDMVIEREALEDDLTAMMRVDELRNRYANENEEVANMSIGEMTQYINNKLKKANENINSFVANRGKEGIENAENIAQASEQA